MIKASTMEMKMILSMMVRSIRAVEDAQEALKIQHRDLNGQADWIRDEIRKMDEPEVPPLGCDRGTMVNQNMPEELCKVGFRVDSDLPPGTMEFWQDGKRIGRVESIGVR